MNSIKSALYRPFRQPQRQDINYPTDLRELVPVDGRATVNAVLIHDVTIGRDAAWQQDSANNGWRGCLTAVDRQMRIFAYGYSANTMTELSHMLDSDTIERHAEDLLDSLAANLGSQSAPNESSAAEADVEITSDESLVPLIVVAHGYGGLIYERALLSSRSAEENFLRSPFQLAFLLGTPHYGAGLGEWAIMCAKKLNIHCASNAQSQKWTDNLKRHITLTREVQKRFRDILKGGDSSYPMIKVAGCFANWPVPKSKLTMSPEWAVMPEFTPISIGTDHFGLTKLSGQGPDFMKVKATLESWYERIPNTHAIEEALPEASSSRPILSPISISQMFVQPFQFGTFSNPEYLPQMFFPQFLLPEVVDATIRGCLSNAVMGSISDLVKYSRQNPRTFLTLAFTNLIAKLPLLYSSKFTDQCLPIEYKVIDQSNFKVNSIPHSDSVVSSDPDSQVTRHLEGFDEGKNNEKGWGFADVTHFISRQWTFLVANFEKAEFGFAVNWERPLPYVKLEAESADERNPVNIFRLGLRDENLVSIMEAKGYLRKNSRSPTPLLEIAVKHLRIPAASPSAQLRYFHKEVRILKAMRDLDDDHLIHAVSAYEKGSEQFIILPWAHSGNLSDFWRSSSKPASPQVRRLVWFQIEGLCMGLWNLHKKGLRHGGLKPENILIFEDPRFPLGKLVIADVGLSLFYAEELKCRQDEGYSTIAKRGTLRYEPPEIELLKPMHISPAYDSWSLGCILFEFIVWVLRGSEGQDQFSKELLEAEPHLERFWGQDDNGDSVLHPAVDGWLKRMEPKGRLFSQIQQQVAEDLLQPSLKSRKDVASFYGFLGPIINTADANSFAHDGWASKEELQQMGGGDQGKVE